MYSISAISENEKLDTMIDELNKEFQARVKTAYVSIDVDLDEQEGESVLEATVCIFDGTDEAKVLEEFSVDIDSNVFAYYCNGE